MGRPRSERPKGLAGQLGERIEQLRKAKAWDAAQLADAAQVGLGTVIRVEAGRASPTLKVVIAVAHALGMSAAELMNDCDDWSAGPMKKKGGTTCNVAN
jgi:transcriptional regulator with XRE-family HTH domain